jgi:hypothetical protein
MGGAGVERGRVQQRVLHSFISSTLRNLPNSSTVQDFALVQFGVREA